MKLLAKVVNASRDVFRRVEPLKMELFTKIINGWKPPSEIFCWVLKPPLDSVFNYFRQKLYLRSLKELICLCIYLVRQFWRWINESSKEYYEETQKNGNKYVVSEKSSSKNFVNVQEKHPREIAFSNKVAGYLTLTGNVLLGNLWNFRNSFHKNYPRMVASALSCP